MTNDTTTAKPKATLKRKVLRVFLTLVVFYILLCVGVCAVQRRLIYFPTKLDPKLAEIMAEKADFSPWKNLSGQIMGWKLSASGTSTGSVLIVHGNAGCAIDRGYFARPIHDAVSVDVFLLEYPGYGAREGSPCAKSFLAAADESFSLLESNHPIYVISESLGTGVAAHLAQTHGNKIAGMALFVPYNNFAKLAQTKMPFLPVSLILLDRYDPEKWLKDYRGPIQFVLAENDEIIPPKFGRKLYESYRGPKNLQITEGAHHNDVGAQSSDWWKGVFSFWHLEREK